VEKTRASFKGEEGKNTTFVKVDHKDAAGLKAAIGGAEIVVIVPPMAPDRDDYGVALIEAAKSAGAKGVLLIGALGDTDLFFGRQFNKIERALLNSGLKYIAARFPFFLENNFSNVGSIKGQGAFYAPVKGATRFSYTTHGDIGKVVAHLAARFSKFANNFFYFTGPAPTSNDEIAAILSKHVGKKISFVTTTADQTREVLKSYGLPPQMANGVIELWERADQGGLDLTTNAFQMVTGEAPTSVEAFFAANAATFK
jgi:NAD(P)H dehydrogenase (quinone)